MPDADHDMTSTDISTNMTPYDIEASVVRYAFSHPDGSIDTGDAYQWFWWRIAPIPDWLLWRELHPNGNPGPYGVPVVCNIAARLTGLTQGGSEDGTAFQRRCLSAIRFPQN